MQFSSYTCLKGKTQTGSIDLDTLHAIIKKNPHIDDIEYAREESCVLDEVKRSLPIITPHGIFSPGQKSNEKLIELSGTVFIDIDKFTGDVEFFKSKLIERPEIISCWRSVSGRGVHALAAISNLTQENFREIHKSYLQTLEKDLSITCDNKVCTISAGLVISSDENILINNSFSSLEIEYNESRINSSVSLLSNTRESNRDTEEFIRDSKFHKVCTISAGLVISSDENILINNSFSSLEIEYNESRINSSVSLLSNTRESNRDTEEFIRDSKFRFKSELEFYPEQVVYIPEGKQYFECTLPFNPDGSIKKIENGKRNSILGSYVNNLILHNPHKEEKDFILFMSKLNKNYCITPLPEKELIKLVGSTFNKRSTLKPINPKLKKYWIDPNSFNKLNLFHQFRKDQTIDKLEEFFSDEILNIDCKITTNLISKFTGLGNLTIERRLTDPMKEMIQDHNNEIKKNKPKRKRY